MRIGERVSSEKVPYVLCRCRFCNVTVKVPMGECFSEDQIKSIFEKDNVQLICENITHICKVPMPVGIRGICTVVGFYYDEPVLQVEKTKSKEDEKAVTMRMVKKTEE